MTLKDTEELILRRTGGDSDAEQYYICNRLSWTLVPVVMIEYKAP